jgi:hypothetical protein
MRELPRVKLVKASDFSPPHSSWLVMLVESGLTDLPVGVVVHDVDVLLPSTNANWQAFIRTDRAYRHLGWFRLRALAVQAVLTEYAKRQDEIEAYAVLDAIQAGIDGAEELAAEQLAIDSHAHLFDGCSGNGFPLDATSEALKGIKEYGELIVRRQLNGEEELRIPALESVTRRSRLIELELERRNRHRTVADLLKSSRIEREADENSSFLFKPVDSWLVTELGKAMTSPRRAASLDMATLLLDQVRTLEALALETEKLRPASMVVQIQDDVLKPLVERIEKLENRVTKLTDAAVDDQDDELDTPEVVSCDCPRSDDDVHEQGCVNHPDHKAADWRDNPYSLPPATTEGMKCPVCSVQNRPHHLAGRLISHKTVLHATQEDVYECARRQSQLS